MTQDNTLSSWVKSYILRFWYVFIVALLLIVASVFLQLLAPLPLKALADYVFGTLHVPYGFDRYSKDTLLLFVVGAFVAVGLLQGLWDVLSSYIFQRLNQLVDRHSMLDSFISAMRIPANQPERLSSGRYVYEITNQSQQLSSYILGSFTTLMRSLLTLAGVLIVLLRIDWHMTAVCFVSIPFLVVSVRSFGSLLERVSDEVETNHAKIYEYINETMTKIRTVQVFAKEHVRAAGVSYFIGIRNKSANKRLIVNQLFGVSTQIVVLIAVSIVLLVGGKSVLAHNLSFGDLLLFITYMGSVFGPLTSISSVFGSIKQEKAALLQVHGTIQSAKRLQPSEGKISDHVIQGKIDLQDVSLSLKDKTILEHVNLSIEPHSITAFVGPSGQGKSSLLNMIIRMVQPERGWVKIDNIDVRDFTLESLRHQIAVIEQEPDIFNMSVAHNVLMGRPDEAYPAPEIIGALETANANEFTEKMAQGYDTIIDQSILSGGQKQRIAMARAVYKKTSILLMDEPTSALDNEAAHIFVDNLFKYMKNKTVIMVTHDLKLLDRISNIYVVNNKSVKPISEYGGLESYRSQISEQSK